MLPYTLFYSNLREAVLFWHEATGHPSVDVMARLAQHPPVGWPQELTTPAVVRKHYPQFCASCPLGNLQDTDRYDNFNPTVIGQVELDLKTWTESSGKRAYSFSNQYISATCMDLKSGMIFGSEPSAYNDFSIQH